MRLVGLQCIDNRILSSEGDSIGLDKGLQEVLYFLTNPYQVDDCWKLVRNASEFMAHIMQLMTEKEIESLYKGQELKLSFPVKDSGEDCYEIFFISEVSLPISTWFSIRYNRNNMTFYSMKQYDYDDELPDEPNPQELVSLAEKVITVSRRMGFYPHQLYSPISILRPYYEQMDIPTDKDIPEEAGLYANRVGTPFWKEAFTLGLSPNSTVLDLSSAYPNIHATLLDIRLGKWERKKEFDPLATYGYCKCICTIFPNVMVSPIRIQNPRPKDEETAYASIVGIFACYLTKRQIDFVHRWHLGSVSVIDGWFFYPSPFCPTPLHTFIHRLLKIKQTAPDLFTRQLAKQFVNQFWGLTRKFTTTISAEEKRAIAALPEEEMITAMGNKRKFKFGPLHNSVYASEIITQVNCKVASTIYRRKIIPLVIATDSFASEGDLTPTETEIAMGWKIKNKGEMLVVSTGRVYYADKHPGSLDIQDMKDMISEFPHASIYYRDVERITTLGQAIRAKDLTLVGKIQTVETGLDLTAQEHSRHFAKLPQSGRALLLKRYPSTPYQIEIEDGQNRLVEVQSAY